LLTRGAQGGRQLWERQVKIGPVHLRARLLAGTKGDVFSELTKVQRPSLTEKGPASHYSTWANPAKISLEKPQGRIRVYLPWEESSRPRRGSQDILSNRLGKQAAIRGKNLLVVERLYVRKFQSRGVAAERNLARLLYEGGDSSFELQTARFRIQLFRGRS